PDPLSADALRSCPAPPETAPLQASPQRLAAPASPPERSSRPLPPPLAPSLGASRPAHPSRFGGAMRRPPIVPGAAPATPPTPPTPTLRRTQTSVRRPRHAL